MLDPALYAQIPAAAPRAAAAAPRAVFTMIRNDRMAGSVPAWITATSPKESTIGALSRAGGQPPSFADSMTSANAIAAPPDDSVGTIAPSDETPFGFGDLVDIVNPLHHIPVVGTLYREISGDRIRPSSEILGGAIFGGAAGAAASLANVILREETGASLGEHAVAMIKNTPSEPVTRLAAAENPPELPDAVLGFVDLSHPAPPRKAPVFKLNE